MTYTPAEWDALTPDQRGPCDEWQGFRDRTGYGQWGEKQAVVRAQYGTLRVHRIEWIKAYGQPPEDKPCVLHHCDNPPCRRLDHLFVGTQTDNMRDCSAKGRVRNQNQDKDSCPKCGGAFRTDPKTGGRWCRPCQRELQRAWEERNRERRLAYRREWYQSHKAGALL